MGVFSKPLENPRSLIYIKKLFIAPVLMVALGLLFPGWAAAQTFSILHGFSDMPTNTSANANNF